MTRRALLAVAGVLMANAAAGGELQPGDKAPDFSLAASDGRTYRLADYAGK